MCKFSDKLIAWLDREISPGEAAEIEHHLGICVECRGQLAAYERVSTTFNSYCDVAMASSVHPTLLRWVLAGAAAAAAVAALFLASQYTRPQPSFAPAAAAMVRQPLVAETVRPPAAPIKPAIATKMVHRERPVSPSPLQDTMSSSANWQASEPAIQIAIPAEALFPPGAVPEWASFTADVTLAADGSAQRLRLRP